MTLFWKGLRLFYNFKSVGGLFRTLDVWFLFFVWCFYFKMGSSCIYLLPTRIFMYIWCSRKLVKLYGAWSLFILSTLMNLLTMINQLSVTYIYVYIYIYIYIIRKLVFSWIVPSYWLYKTGKMTNPSYIRQKKREKREDPCVLFLFIL